MRSSHIFVGYPGRVWTACYASMRHLVRSVNAATDPESTEAIARTVWTTLRNGVEAINANHTAFAWQTAINQLIEVAGLPIPISDADALTFVNRLGAFEGAFEGLTNLVPDVTPDLGDIFSGHASNIDRDLNQGIPAIPETDLLGFYQNFNYETSPTGLSIDNLTQGAYNVAAAFTRIANEIAVVQEQELEQTYDLMVRLSRETTVIANLIGDLNSSPLSPSVPPNAMWNQLISAPSLALDADYLTTVPHTLSHQQDLVIRHALITLTEQIEDYLMSLRKPTSGHLVMSQLLIGESLMDFANRVLGDFEQWQAIAAINGLVPPYVGSRSAPGIAEWGSTLILPGSVLPTGPVPNYLINFLGTDVYVGPINGEMPTWTGEFQLVSGYNNLRWALGRRMQTSLGTLIYHSDYGSRIPPEVGNVQTESTAGHIAAFGKSCLLSDPRVGSVLSATATRLPNFAIAFDGTVQAGGFGTRAIPINEILQPNPI